MINSYKLDVYVVRSMQAEYGEGNFLVNVRFTVINDISPGFTYTASE